ncbi:MAG: phosphoglucomutase/phosphomannomutase family protein [candidate division NC10 bacterium]|nr:phosphoglucomutase/phosphomannomutase family protein [candidate division NC10 bacterium]
MSEIKFGTSGWRGMIADDFTFTNVRIVTQAIAEHLISHGFQERGAVIGHDTRFLSEAFAHQAAKIVAGNDIRAFLCVHETPTPTISYETIRRKAGGAINITASHNPAQYNGLKFSSPDGGPALPEITRMIEARVQQLLGSSDLKEVSTEEAEAKGLLEKIDPREVYLERLRALVDLDVIASSQMKMVVDVLYGTGRGYLDEALQKAGCQVKVLHDWRDPYFGHAAPDPSEENLKELAFHVMEDGCHLGLATDGDADRYGIVDADGTFILPNYVLALLLKYLIQSRGWKGAVARSVATTHLVDAVAKRYGVPVIETPVGFKYIGELISKDLLILGGEESAGLSIKGHIPEKDGILACLLVAEMLARANKPRVRHLLRDLFLEVGGPVYTRRINFQLEPASMDRLREKLRYPPFQLGEQKVVQVKDLDGMKLMFGDESWVLFRASGTEPVARLYVEARDDVQMSRLLAAGRDFIHS